MAELELLGGVREVPREAWNALVGEGSPFLEWEWLASLEESGALGRRSGWTPCPLVAREGGRLVAACPLYLKAHSEGEFVFDHGWAEAAERAGIAYYPKLLVGVPFTPVTGGRLLTAPEVERAAWLPRLAAGLRELCRAHALSGVHVNFCLDDEGAALAEAGFLPRLGLQYHWSNSGYGELQDFLARLRSKRRNQIARERRTLAARGVAIETHAGDDIPEDAFGALFDLYSSTVDKHPWGRRYLNRRFFELLRQRFRSRLHLVLAREAGRIVAGAINVRKAGVLYGRYWGALREIRNLHFEICYYRAIEHCIDEGLQRFEPGAGGDFKQMRGFDAIPTRSLHFLAEPRLHHAVARFLDAERAEAARAIDWLREHSALKA